MQNTETEKRPDVEVTISLHPGLAAYMTEVSRRRGETLAEIVKAEVEMQWYVDSGIPVTDALDSLFPGLADEARVWERENDPIIDRIEKKKPVAEPKGESVCMVMGCEAEDVSPAVIISFPSDEDEIAIASGKQFKLIAPICRAHANIFRAASSKTDVADAITRPEFVSYEPGEGSGA